MSLDLGTLFATIDVDDGPFRSKIKGAKTDLVDLQRTADATANTKLDVTPTGTGAVTTAAQEAQNLDTNLQKASKSGTGLKVSSQPAAELGRADNAAGKLVDSIGKVTSGALTKTIKWGAITSATAAIGGMGVALTKGFSRLNDIDQAEAKLTGLGHSTANVSAIMDDALASVKGTAFGMGDAATIAASAVAAGIEPGEALQRTLKLTGDAATIAGTELGEMGSIINKVATSDMMQMDVANQLMDAGIPILQLVAKEMGVTADEARKMASDGEVSFETFQNALEEGMGGAALAAGDTFQGAMNNAGAAVGRLGEKILQPAFDAAPGVIGNITDSIDELGDRAGPMAEKLTVGLSDFAQGAIPQVKAALGTLKDTAQAVWPVVEKIGTVMTAIPMEAYVGLLGMAVAKHKGLTGAMSKGMGSFDSFLDNVTESQSALKGQGREIGVVSTAMMTLGQRVPAIGRMGDAYRKAGDGLRLAGMESRAMGRELGGLNRVAGTAKGTLQSFGGVVGGSVAGGLSLAKTAGQGLLTAVGGLPGLIFGGVTAAIMALIKQHQDAAAEVERHKQKQNELRDSLDETTGKITEQTEQIQLKSLEESGVRDTARKLGMSDDMLIGATTGDAQATRDFTAKADADIDQKRIKNIEGSDYWQNYGEYWQGQGYEAGDVADAIAADEASGGTAEIQSMLNDVKSANPDKMGRGNEWSEYFREFRDGAREAAGATGELKNEVLGMGEMTTDVVSAEAEQKLNNYAESAKKAKDATELLSDETTRLESPDELRIEVDEDTRMATKEALEDIGYTVEDLPESNELSISMPDGTGVLMQLEQMGDAVKYMEDGQINVKAMTDEAQQELVELGLAAEIDGEVRIKDDIGSTIARLHEMGVLSVVDGKLVIDNDLDSLLGQLRETELTRTALHEIHHELPGLLDQLRESENPRSADHKVISNIAQIAAQMDAQDRRQLYATLTIEERRVVSNQVMRQGAAQMGQAMRQSIEAQNNADGGRLPRNARGSRLPRNASGARHGGYRLPTTGPGTGVVDGILGVDGNGAPSSWVDAGEWIVNRDSSETWDGTLAAVNGGNVSQVVQAFLTDLEQFANGGRTSDRVKSELSPYNGTPYVFGGWGPGGTDCSGAVSMGVNSYLGRDPLESRTGTGNMAGWLAERGFQQGRGGPGDVVVGWYNGGPGGGHTAMVLPDGTFIESGGNTGGGLTIGGAAGPLDGRGFTDWAYLPGDGGEVEDGYDEMGSYSAYSSSAGGSSGGGGSSVSKSVNGGAGPLLKDGSVLEAAAAAWALHNNTPMADDVVSWGNVLGLGTTFEGENLETEQRRHEREMRAHDRNIQSTERDLAQAKKDIGEKEKALAEAKPEDKEQAQWELDDARDKVADLSDKLIDMRDETEELRKTNEQLKVAVEKQKAAPTSAGQAFGITAMADGAITGTSGILGAARDAQFNEGSAILWGEAGDEAYIPLSRNKRARSLDLWAETGKRLGVDVLSMANLIGSGLPGLMEGKLQFSSGDTTSLDRLGLNMDAAKHAGGREIGSAIGAVFNGPVTVNDPRGYLQAQMNNASRQINKAMKSRML
ncbi:tape measure protein [Corynebacterium sp. USCH3]|uniref:tape measure protein n=1 Tax=Corynebacterium sp. USCH3 TaxID=3024840 RepID=UPI00309C76CA